MKKLTVIAVSALVFAVGCGDDGETSNNGGEEGGFEAGDYVVTVLDVDDGCFDGAINTIVLPSGEPRELPEPVTLPAHSDLPSTIDINFNEPFQDVTGADVEASGNAGIASSGNGIPQTDVDIGSNEGDVCDADMNVNFTLTESEPGKLTGQGTLTITSAEGADCPAFIDGPPCEVTTPIEAVKN